MQTVITTFDDRDAAKRARDRLVQAGIARQDVHLKMVGGLTNPGRSAEQAAIRESIHRQPEREVAVDRGTLDSIGRFFTSLFGLDHQKGYAGSYADAVRNGHAVLIVDARDELEAERVLNLMHAEGSMAKPEIVKRDGQAALRDVVLTDEDPLETSATVDHVDEISRP